MYLERIHDDELAQSAWLIGCKKSGEAALIDPERDIDRYLVAAKRQGFRIIAVAETHVHADFLSGTREMAEATGATITSEARGTFGRNH